MAVFLQDDFLASANTTLNGWAADVGGSWVQSGAFSSGMGYISATMTVLGDGAGVRSSTTTTPGSIGYNPAAAPSPDYSVKFNISRYVSGGTGGVVLRLDPVAQNCYFVSLSTSNAVIYKSLGGTRETLATFANGSVVPTSGYVPVEITIVGNIISIYVDGVEYASYEDTTSPITDAGYVGIGSRYALIQNLQAETLDGAFVSADIESVSTSDASFVGHKAVSTEIASVGTTPVCYMQSATFRVGDIRVSDGTSTAEMIGLPLITSQMYSLSQPPEPDFHSIAFEDLSGVMAADGTTGGRFVGRSIAAADILVEAGASDAFVGRGFEEGEGEFKGAGSAVGAFSGTRVVVGRMVAPAGSEVTFRMFGVTFIETVMSAAGSSVADMSGIVSVRMEAAGSASGDFGPVDVTVAAEIAGGGAAIGDFKELEFAVGRFGGARATSTARFWGVKISGAAIKSAGVAGLKNWIGSTIYTSQFTSEGLVGGRMLSLSFSDDIPTPADRVAFLPAEDRTVILVAEDREVLAPAEDREVLLPAETRIIYL